MIAMCLHTPWQNYYVIAVGCSDWLS